MSQLQMLFGSIEKLNKKLASEKEAKVQELLANDFKGNRVQETQAPLSKKKVVPEVGNP